MIEWTKYFDKIYCINYVQFTKRKQLMEFELNRVGILNSAIFEWETTYQGQKNEKFSSSICSLILGHKNAIKKAYENGYQRILIIEDDIRFLKDLNKLEQILEHRPQNYNIILYDKTIKNKQSLQQFISINQYYSLFKSCGSAACYQLDRKGMQKILNLLESDINPIDVYFIESEKYLKKINFCCSTTNLAVQVIFKYCNLVVQYCIDDYLKISQPYIDLNISYDDYMMKKDGSNYKYGEYIEE